MALPTTPVYAIFTDSDGSPLPDVTVTVQLNRTDLEDGGYIVPAYHEFITDENGRVDMELWPNERGSTESIYVVRAWKRDGTRVLQVEAAVPDTETEQNLTSISTLPPYPGKGDGALALEAAVEAEEWADESEEWAITPEDTLVPSGNGVDEYSSLHHAAKSEGSATSASSSETAAAASETAAASSESNAASSETAAASSESSASDSASNAAASETDSEEHSITSQRHASEVEDTGVVDADTGNSTGTFSSLHHAAKASASESAAATSESNAATSESNAASSETNAAGSASAAATSESNAADSETNAASSASAASTSETNAASSEAAAEASFDSFDDRYLGAKSSDPGTDNDGNALIEGALYWNTTAKEIRAWDGVQWVSTYVPVPTAATSNDPGLAFDTWRTPDEDHLTLVSVSVQVCTDGSTNGRVKVQVDEGGGTTADYDYDLTIQAAVGSTDCNTFSFSFLVPAGGSYQIKDSSSPSANQILTHREFSLEGSASLTDSTGINSIDPGLAFNTWRTPNTENPTRVELEVVVYTDGTNNGVVQIEVDESGGTALDYRFRFLTPPSLGNSSALALYGSFYIPAGGSYQINNDSDPVGFNNIDTHREWTL